MNILHKADEIVNQRTEEQDRKYGPFSEGMERAAMIATGMTGREWSGHDMFVALIALKLSRQSYHHKEDNLLDGVAYLGAWSNYIDECLAEGKEVDFSVLNDIREGPASK
jgi:hypothetical protein